ncbi:MAG: hypothetical protein U0L91_06050 [Gemmiger sp.]|uniref:hypothetical protein n=1 Tax=Gemmiger sp. TaxID=2049027 RepID=UPI002E7A3AB4|nr:hypothetical protein [Gemmiger sp.]MEE0800826.1 hypothetical protein [Gemmiger sp.]
MAWVTKDSTEQYNQTPEPPREYTKQEKAANWWHYNKWIVIGVAIAVFLLVWLVHDVVTQVEPDYRVAYIGQSDLPVDTADALTNALQAFGTDCNGDGQVVVQLDQYNVDFNSETDNTDAYSQMAGVTRLSADLADGGAYIFLLEDPAGFVQSTGALCYLDGTMPDQDHPENDDWHQMVYHWTDCPVLTGLDLGTYTGLTMLDDQQGSSQDVLAGLYVGRRALFTEKQEDHREADEAMWQALTAGAVSTVKEDE